MRPQVLNAAQPSCVLCRDSCVCVWNRTTRTDQGAPRTPATDSPTRDGQWTTRHKHTTDNAIQSSQRQGLALEALGEQFSLARQTGQYPSVTPRSALKYRQSMGSGRLEEPRLILCIPPSPPRPPTDTLPPHPVHPGQSPPATHRHTPASPCASRPVPPGHPHRHTPASPCASHQVPHRTPIQTVRHTPASPCASRQVPPPPPHPTQGSYAAMSL